MTRSRRPVPVVVCIKRAGMQESWGLASSLADVRARVRALAVGALNDRVDVFGHTAPGWSLARTLAPPGDAGADEFGASLALSGDRIAVGAYAPAGPVGAVHVYEGSGGSWNLAASIFAPDTADEFGASIAIDGPRMLISRLEPTTVMLYEAFGGGWTHTTTFEPDTPVSYFGSSVDWWGPSGPPLALDGEVIVIGNRADWDRAASAGAAYVFERGDSSWSRSAKLYASDAYPYQAFGSAVAISGDTIVVGAPGDNDHANGDAGAVYVFERGAGGWSEVAKLVQEPWVQGDALGTSVAIDGDCLVAGAPMTWCLSPGGATANGRGSAHVFCRDGNEWSERARLGVPDGFPVPDLNLGRSVGISGETVVVGAQWSAVVFEIPRETGAPCSADQECASGKCDNAICGAAPELDAGRPEAGAPTSPTMDASGGGSELPLDGSTGPVNEVLLRHLAPFRQMARPPRRTPPDPTSRRGASRSST